MPPPSERQRCRAAPVVPRRPRIRVWEQKQSIRPQEKPCMWSKATPTGDEPYRGTSAKNTPARGSVGRCFLNLRNPRATPVGLRFLESRKCTKTVGPLFLKIKRTHESGWSGFLKMRPVRVTVRVEFFKGTRFPREMLALFSALKRASSILREVKRYEANCFSQHT